MRGTETIATELRIKHGTLVEPFQSIDRKGAKHRAHACNGPIATHYRGIRSDNAAGFFLPSRTDRA
jgi:hypothetical protein